MSENYVTKELYEAGMKEIRALIAASEARHEKTAAEIQKAAAEMKEQNTRQYGDMLAALSDELRQKTNEINYNLSKMFSFSTLIITIVVVLLSIFNR